MDKEREAFEEWFESRYDAHFMQFALDLDFYVDKHTQTCWEAWQAAKAQAVPETKKFNLDEFLVMEEKLKSKGGIIKADLDRFIAYAEMVLEKAKAIREPK